AKGGTRMFTDLATAKKSLEPKTFRAIHREAVMAVEELKSKEVNLIRVLQEVDESLTYRYLGFSSLYSYCVEGLKLSESQAMMYISVARKSKQLPALQQALEAGEVSVSKVKRVVPVIDNSNQQYWLELVQTSTKREIEKAVAKVNPRAVHHEKARYVTDTLVELQVPVSEKVFDLLKRAQEVLTQKQSKIVSLEEVIRVMTEKYLDKEDPIRREDQRREARRRVRGAKAADDQPNSDEAKCVLEPRNSREHKAAPGVESVNTGKLATSTVRMLHPKHSISENIDAVSSESDQVKAPDSAPDAAFQGPGSMAFG
ncbi:MAG: hypothetical protein AB7H97_19175, partial [Pseudobdellovibrionaceae bacterium]